jgi:hypothetical protein
MKSFVYTNVIKTDGKELSIMFLLGIGDYLKERCFYKKKPSIPIAIGIDGFCMINKSSYPNKSNTKEGNNPKMIFKAIDTTATA